MSLPTLLIESHVSGRSSSLREAGRRLNIQALQLHESSLPPGCCRSVSPPVRIKHASPCASALASDSRPSGDGERQQGQSAAASGRLAGSGSSRPVHGCGAASIFKQQGRLHDYRSPMWSTASVCVCVHVLSPDMQNAALSSTSRMSCVLLHTLGMCECLLGRVTEQPDGAAWQLDGD